VRETLEKNPGVENLSGSVNDRRCAFDIARTIQPSLIERTSARLIEAGEAFGGWPYVVLALS